MWIDFEYFKSDASQYLIQIRTLINQMKKYGVNEDILFHEDDLLYRNNIPKVVRSLKQVAMIVSINIKIMDKKKLAQTDSPIETHVCSQSCCNTKLITLPAIAINSLNLGSKWCRAELITNGIF